MAQWFDRQRGLALGIATAGVGLGVVVLPPFLALLINDFGWRNAYFGWMAVLLLAWLPVALFVREPPALSRVAARHTDRNLTKNSLTGTEASRLFGNGSSGR